MRIQIHIDSASADQLRALLAELARLGHHEAAAVGLNGPDCWTATTPHLTPNEFARIFATLVKKNGVPLKDLVTP